MWVAVASFRPSDRCLEDPRFTRRLCRRVAGLGHCGILSPLHGGPRHRPELDRRDDALGDALHQWRPLVRRRVVAMRVLEGGVLAAVMLPGLWQLSQVAARADQWSSFASNTRWSTVVDLFPWLFWNRTSHRSRRLDLFLSTNRQENAFQITEARDREWLILLGYVGFGTMIVGLVDDRFANCAPHAPTLSVRAYPAIVLSERLLSRYGAGLRWHGSRVRHHSVVDRLARTIEQWRSGQWIAWQRGEDWRAAVQFLTVTPFTISRFFLAPMLIETSRPRIEADAQDDYLRYPLTSQYPLDPRTPIYVLPNDTSHWPNRFAGDRSLPFQSVAWIVVRKNLVPRPRFLDSTSIRLRSSRFALAVTCIFSNSRCHNVVSMSNSLVKPHTLRSSPPTGFQASLGNASLQAPPAEMHCQQRMKRGGASNALNSQAEPGNKCFRGNECFRGGDQREVSKLPHF